MNIIKTKSFCENVDERPWYLDRRIIMLWFGLLSSCAFYGHIVAQSCNHHSVSQVYAPQTRTLEGWTTRWNPDFRLTFQWLVAQNEYSRPWKVPPSKFGFHLLSILPKSAFAMDNVDSCEFDTESTHRHAIILWHSCEFNRHIAMLHDSHAL